jgi:phosphopentomutase
VGTGSARLVAEPPCEPPPSAGGRRVVAIVCDSLGVGGAHDAEAYGDAGADTLGHVAAAVGGLDLPLLVRWGIGWLTDVAGVPPDGPDAVVGRLEPSGAGKDSTTGHWELMGLRTEEPFPVYPDGFPPDVIGAFSDVVDRTVLGNRPASGTAIINELGAEHLETGAPIVYTSADSVFQVATHVEVVPLETLYTWCEAARRILDGEHRVGRVIARPFAGPVGAFVRTPDRRDFAVEPPGTTACDVLHRSGIPVKAAGKIEDLFVGRGITWSAHTGGNDATIEAVARFLVEDGPAFVFANLVDFDQSHGHRNDPEGYADALERFDEQMRSVVLPELLPGDRVMVTADHGTDPTTPSTDHTRERVPLLGWGTDLERGRDIGVLDMVDVGATVLDVFGLDPGVVTTPGRSFAETLQVAP